MDVGTFRKTNFLINVAIDALENNAPRSVRNLAMNNFMDHILEVHVLCDTNNTECTCTNHQDFNRLRYLLQNS